MPTDSALILGTNNGYAFMDWVLGCFYELDDYMAISLSKPLPARENKFLLLSILKPLAIDIKGGGNRGIFFFRQRHKQRYSWTRNIRSCCVAINSKGRECWKCWYWCQLIKVIIWLIYVEFYCCKGVGSTKVESDVKCKGYDIKCESWTLLKWDIKYWDKSWNIYVSLNKKCR